MAVAIVLDMAVARCLSRLLFGLKAADSVTLGGELRLAPVAAVAAAAGQRGGRQGSIQRRRCGAKRVEHRHVWSGASEPLRLSRWHSNAMAGKKTANLKQPLAISYSGRGLTDTIVPLEDNPTLQIIFRPLAKRPR